MSTWRNGNREEAMAESRVSGQGIIKPEPARPKCCALCGVKAGTRPLAEVGREYLCSGCRTSSDERRRYA